jgi:hypothetical protein
MFSIFSFPTSSDFYATREDLQSAADLALRPTGSGDLNSSFVKERIRWPWPGQKARARSSILTSLIREVGMGCPRPFNTLQTASKRCGLGHSASLRGVALGRVILIGDAAHVFPPFGDQGIASGFRDASSLAWRLAILSRNSHSANHDKVLAAWHAERKQQLERSLAATIQNGAYVTENDPWKTFVRDWYLWAIQLVPGGKRDLEKGPRKDGMIRYQYQSGMPFLPQYGGGVCFPQVYCAGLDGAQNVGQVVFTDDLIYGPLKEGLWFWLIALMRLTCSQCTDRTFAALARTCAGRRSHNLWARLHCQATS